MENDTLTWTVTGNGSFLYTCVFRTVHCVVWFTNCIIRMFSWFFDWQFACELASGETWLNTCAKTIQPQIRTKWQETGRKMVSCNEVLSLKGAYSTYRIAPNSKEMKLITLNWYHGDEMEDFCLWLKLSSLIRTDNKPFLFKWWFHAGVKDVKDLLDSWNYNFLD